MKKKFAIVFLSLFLVISLPFAAHANIVTATGKYLITAIKHIPGGAKVNATNTATGAKHAINHGVSAPALGAAIGGGLVGMAVGNGVGLAFQAITGLALDAVDFIMDPTNNQVKWKLKNEGGAGEGGAGKYLYSVKGYPGSFVYSAPDVCTKVVGVLVYKHWSSYKWTYNSDIGTYGGCRSSITDVLIDRAANPNYVPPPPEDFWKKLPLNDLAAKTIEQADGGEVLSQQDIEDYVTNLAKDGKLDAELDNATDITPPEGTEPDEPTKPDDPDKDCPLGTTKVDDVCVKPSDPDTPLFCNSGEFTRKVCDWIDWTQEKPDDLKSNDGKIDVIDKSDDLEIDEDRIVFDDQCPPPTPIELVVMGFPYSEELSYQPFCDFFGMLNPFVVGMGGISSALIIAGGIRRG